ncbi:DUF397 domain-containing protein [Streptomyces sp. NPDC086023]|uniref:DUF397 domain-containing protein n=1 Tax=Streptomyces sp. NPDC086023 TaxID=3365746 RepID=UPI0037D97D47
MSKSELTWFKSTYSGSDGGECVEVALAWHKSTHSRTDGDSCVEVATCSCSTTVHVRDSKDTTLPSFQVTPTAWAAFVAHI